MVIELFFSLGDFLLGLMKRNDFIKELKFIPTRLAICILLRDLITFGARIDIVRGLPVIHLNFLGYDEHAHRRGATSRFAHGTLRGIDNCIAKIYNEALHATRRNYGVWIYSDHGQEEVLSYVREYKQTIHEAVQEVFNDFRLEDNYLNRYDPKGIQSQRARFLGEDLFKRITPFKPVTYQAADPGRLIVTAMGPLGHVYVPQQLTIEDKKKFAYQLVESARVPLVFITDGSGQVKAFNDRGEFKLPEQAGDVFGKEHPFLREVTQDIIRTCLHSSSGAFTISGWKPTGKTYSFPSENGAHGGPGSEETSAFALLPANIAIPAQKSYLRPKDLREIVLGFLDKSESIVKGGAFINADNRRQNSF